MSGNGYAFPSSYLKNSCGSAAIASGVGYTSSTVASSSLINEGGVIPMLSIGDWVVLSFVYMMASPDHIAAATKRPNHFRVLIRNLFCSGRGSGWGLSESR